MEKKKGKLPALSGATDAMSLTSHLSELKTRISRIVIAFVAMVIVCSFFVETLVSEFIRKGEGFNFIYISPAELVTCYVQITLLAALVLAAPLILSELWGFVKPGLLQSEKRAGFLSLLGGTVFFILGAVFAYLVAAPFTLNFFATFGTTGQIDAQISFQSYVNFLLSTLLTFGLVFEMPMLTLFLSQLGIIKPKFLIKTRKIAVLLIFIIAAVITPPDIISQVAIAIPMLLLYEISILVCKVITKRKQEQENAEAAAA